MMKAQTYINKQGDEVKLLDNTAINVHGDKLLWLECCNGAKVSIFEEEFNKQFKLITVVMTVKGTFKERLNRRLYWKGIVCYPYGTDRVTKRIG